MSTALSESLWEKVDVVRDSGQHGAKSCVGMANFLSERAAIETTYGNVRNVVPPHVDVTYKHASQQHIVIGIVLVVRSCFVTAVLHA